MQDQVKKQGRELKNKGGNDLLKRENIEVAENLQKNIHQEKDIERFYIFYYRGIYEMKWKNGGIWINYEYKKDYQDSSQKGLRVIYSKKIDNESIGNLKKFINFLRKWIL